jgi:hypothetical protein
LDPDLFPGIQCSLEQGDPTLLNGSLADIEERILRKQAIQQSFKFTPNSGASARRANFANNPTHLTNKTTLPFIPHKMLVTT